MARVRTLVDAWSFREGRARRARMEAAAGEFDPTNLTRLARELSYAGVPPLADLLDAAGFVHSCLLHRIDPEGAVAHLRDAHAAITTDPDNNAFTTAVKLADSGWERFELPRGQKPTWRKVAALVYWLGRLRPDREYVPVPRNMIAEWLDVRDCTAGDILTRLDAMGEIQFRRDGTGRAAYSFKGKEAREARFIGQPPTSRTAVA